MSEDKGMPVSTADLDAWEALCNAATEGPWDVDEGDFSVYSLDDNHNATLVFPACADCINPDDYENDARLTIAMRNALPELLEEMQTLQARALHVDAAATELAIQKDALVCRAIEAERQRDKLAGHVAQCGHCLGQDKPRPWCDKNEVSIGPGAVAWQCANRKKCALEWAAQKDGGA